MLMSVESAAAFQVLGLSMLSALQVAARIRPLFSLCRYALQEALQTPSCWSSSPTPNTSSGSLLCTENQSARPWRAKGSPVRRSPQRKSPLTSLFLVLIVSLSWFSSLSFLSASDHCWRAENHRRHPQHHDSHLGRCSWSRPQIYDHLQTKGRRAEGGKHVVRWGLE